FAASIEGRDERSDSDGGAVVALFHSPESGPKSDSRDEIETLSPDALDLWGDAAAKGGELARRGGLDGGSAVGWVPEALSPRTSWSDCARLRASGAARSSSRANSAAVA